MKILITGHAGYIGSRLTKELLRLGHTIFGMDNFSTGKREKIINDNFLTTIECDLRDLDLLKSNIRNIEPDYIFHLAAAASVPDSILRPHHYWENNVTATSNLLQAINKQVTRKIIFSSSSSVYGTHAGASVKEYDTDQARQLSPYAFSKITCERMFELFYRLYGIEYVALRYFNVYDGEGGGRGVIDKWTREKNAGINSAQYGNVKRDFTKIENVINANILAMNSSVLGSFNIGEGKLQSLDEIAIKLNIHPRRLPAKDCDVQECSADLSKSNALLNYYPI